MANFTCKSCYYLFILLPAKGFVNFIACSYWKLKYQYCKPIKLKKFLMQQYNILNSCDLFTGEEEINFLPLIVRNWRYILHAGIIISARVSVLRPIGFSVQYSKMILAANRRLRITLLMPEWRDKYVPRDMRCSRMYDQGMQNGSSQRRGICVRKPCGTKTIYSVAPTPDFQMRKAHHRSKSIKDLTGKILNTFYFRIVNPVNQEKQGHQSSPK